MVDNIEQWMKVRKVRIRNRTKKGRYPKSRIRATAYAISRGILQRGIEGSKILETAFKRAERRVGDDVTKLYRDWIDDNVKKIIAEVNK